MIDATVFPPTTIQTNENLQMRGNINSTVANTTHAGINILKKAPETNQRNKLWLAAKIIFFPITALAYLLHGSLKWFIGSKILGDGNHVNQPAREVLKQMGGEEIKFGFEDHAILEGMYFKTDSPNPASQKTILLCTGSPLSYEGFAIPMVEALKSMGHNVMVFNYEGFGKSEGSPSEEGVYRSVEAAYQYLLQVKECRKDSIAGWGYSLGSGAITELACNHEMDIVLDRPFSSMADAAYHAAPFFFKTIAKIVFVCASYFNNIGKISRVKGNVFIAQGKDDKSFEKIHHGDKLQAAAEQGKKATTFAMVDSEHFHFTDVWFGNRGSHRAEVAAFLNRPLT